MDPIETLIHEAIHHEVLLNKNPFVTLETIYLRLYKKIFDTTRVYPTTTLSEKTLLFGQWHDEILEAYEKLRSNLSHDERLCVERVLSKDTPSTTELTKFACCWYKYDTRTACRWFAVDGILGTHPKAYAQEAFAPQFAKHNAAVRALYAYFSKPETIKEVVEKAFLLNVDNEPCASDMDPDFEQGVALYAQMVGESDMQAVAAERKAKSKQQQQQQQQQQQSGGGKRKKQSS